MATTQQIAPHPRLAPSRKTTVTSFLVLAALTPAVLLIHGYHPFADDAGIYTAGIRKLVDPALYQPDSVFVLANTRLSVFAHLLAGIVRTTHLPLEFVLLATHLTSIFFFLLACWSLAGRIFNSPVARWFAVSFAAACFTLPITGTALMLMDPYVTSRSFSTPLGLFALAAAIDHRWSRAGLLLLLTGLMHPLMAIFVAAYLLLFSLVELDHLRSAIILSAFGIIACGVIYLSTRHIPVSNAYDQAIHSRIRSFLFPTEWAWYEDFGLIAPIALFALAARRMGSKTLAGRLCIVAFLLGTAATVSAFLFVHTSGPYLLARLQLLRSFHILYTLGVLLLGGFTGRLLLEPSLRQASPRTALRWTGAALLLAAIAFTMFLAQRSTYPLSAHLELPGTYPRNPWQQAFLWIRSNTPTDAVFAANPELVFLDGEDSQGFRVTTGRSILPDDKDQGVVAVVSPRLAAQWAVQHNAQTNVDLMTDRERFSRLRLYGVTWLLLSASAATFLECPYRNTAAQVCRLSQQLTARASP